MLVASESKNRDIQQIKDISDFFIRELKQREIENKEANANHEGAVSVLPEAQNLCWHMVHYMVPVTAPNDPSYIRCFKVIIRK